MRLVKPHVAFVRVPDDEGWLAWYLELFHRKATIGDGDQSLPGMPRHFHGLELVLSNPQPPVRVMATQSGPNLDTVLGFAGFDTSCNVVVLSVTGDRNFFYELFDDQRMFDAGTREHNIGSAYLVAEWHVGAVVPAHAVYDRSQSMPPHPETVGHIQQLVHMVMRMAEDDAS
jgi:hypothetical protein